MTSEGSTVRTDSPSSSSAGAVTTGGRSRKKRGGSGNRSGLAGLAFVTPLAVVVLMLFLVPLGLLVVMSLSDWPLIGAPAPTGLDNYTAIATNQFFLGAIGGKATVQRPVPQIALRSADGREDTSCAGRTCTLSDVKAGGVTDGAQPPVP